LSRDESDVLRETLQFEVDRWRGRGQPKRYFPEFNYHPERESRFFLITTT